MSYCLKNAVAVLLLLFSWNSYAQLDYTAEVNLKTFASKDGELPFWLYHNQRGRISKNTNSVTWISGKSFYQPSEASRLEAGAGILFQDESDQLQFDELYLDYQNSWIDAVIGRQQKEEFYNGLSSSNESILWSLNARPLPGIQLSTSGPVILFTQIGLGFEASLEEYITDDERYVENARIHHKSLHLVFQPNQNFQIKAGLQHFVQWAGVSKDFGQQPNAFKDYLRVFTGRSGRENAVVGDQQNALGNNLGSYEIHLNTVIGNYDFSLFWNSIFEDGTGQRVVNIPDGRYGLFIKTEESLQWVSSFIYEFYYTKHQSQSTLGPHKFDNYFNNGVYRSGWTYEEKVIGTPFFTTNYYQDDYYNGNVTIGNNSFIAHHVGIAGVAFEQFPYKILSSYRRNYGHHRLYWFNYYPPDDPRGNYIIPAEILSTYLELKVWEKYFNLNLLFAADITNTATNPGVGIHLIKSF